MKRVLLLSLGLVAGCAQFSANPDVGSGNGDAAFKRMADEYITEYLAWRPQTGTSLGFHQYDGKVTDFSRASLDSELARLKSFDARLARLNPATLTKKGSLDYRLLRSAINREIFSFTEMRVYSDNPMTYATVLDVNIYIKRNFAPLKDRLRSIIS